MTENNNCCGGACMDAAGREFFFKPQIGATVPAQSLRVYHNDDIKEINFTDYRGKWLILFFYPADFTFICPTELEEMAAHYEAFQKLETEILSISADTVWVHKAWHDTSDVIKKIKFPMVADPTGALSKMFGTYIEEGEDAGLSQRASFIIDPDGIIRAMEIHDNSIGRSAKELYRKVQAAKFVRTSGGKQVCPAGWSPGDDTLEPGLDLVGKI